ncbi:hypothetical protein A7985_11565 [Pseudoalteromonas luteoviolacea]|uniref:Uncharacterized protein n=1 Tax=Pseudoalteromonas luteoviolacea TaxID=43657 RepID=A0A1C0TQM4_9GAMM|nr:DUF2846 domain-containing protein [Pseudoalteromonas luteoviolacea]OCQ21258.1 hypothetical protein A7985_11565 [Pseudoalteromonas luteoviolacea]
MKYLYCLFLLFLAGCAQPPKNALNYSDAEVGSPNENNAVLVLYRKTVPPVMYSVTSKVNGKEFATLPNNAFSWTYLPAGSHKIEIKWPFLALTPGKTIDLDVDAGKYYFIEFGGETNVAGFGAAAYNTHDITLSNFEQGLATVNSCCKYMPSKL